MFDALRGRAALQREVAVVGEGGRIRDRDRGEALVLDCPTCHGDCSFSSLRGWEDESEPCSLLVACCLFLLLVEDLLHRPAFAAVRARSASHQSQM
jgi:hypothetical protein